MVSNDYLAELVLRYGPGEEPVAKRFRGEYVNGIQGWQFSEAEVKEANRAGRLLTMDLDFPGTRCALNCTYCFAKAGEMTGTYYRPDAGDRPLSLAEVKRAVRGARELGLKSMKIIGYREPFDNPGFYDFIDFADKLGIHLVIFTSGYTLGEENFGGNLGKAIDFLAQRKVSIMLKHHTLDKKAEEKIVRYKNYSDVRDKYLRALLQGGKFTDTPMTRLGLEMVISTRDADELLAMYEYFKVYRNVFVDLDPPIPVGRTGTLEEAEKAGLMPQEALKKLCTDTYRLNEKHCIKFEGVSPYFGGPPCSQLGNSVYITLSGKVVACCGSDEEIGDLRKQTLGEISEKNPYRGKFRAYHACPYRQKRRIMTDEFIACVNDALRRAQTPRVFAGSLP
ncbi:MAG: radical SAM protein [Candidatus Diapherotrites archaeon]